MDVGDGVADPHRVARDGAERQRRHQTADDVEQRVSQVVPELEPDDGPEHLTPPSGAV